MDNNTTVVKALNSLTVGDVGRGLSFIGDVMLVGLVVFALIVVGMVLFSRPRF